MTRHDPATGGAGLQVGTCPHGTSTPTTLARVRYRAPWWSERTATRVRIYARPADAIAAAARLRVKGHTTEISFAERTPWRTSQPAPWSKAVADAPT